MSGCVEGCRAAGACVLRANGAPVRAGVRWHSKAPHCYLSGEARERPCQTSTGLVLGSAARPACAPAVLLSSASLRFAAAQCNRRCHSAADRCRLVPPVRMRLRSCCCEPVGSTGGCIVEGNKSARQQSHQPFSHRLPFVMIFSSLACVRPSPDPHATWRPSNQRRSAFCSATRPPKQHKLYQTAHRRAALAKRRPRSHRPLAPLSSLARHHHARHCCPVALIPSLGPRCQRSTGPAGTPAHYRRLPIPEPVIPVCVATVRKGPR